MSNFTDVVQSIEEGEISNLGDFISRNPDLLVQRDNSELTLLHLSAICGNIPASRILINNGAEIDCIDEVGNTPLIEASLRGNELLIELLLSKGANVNHVNNSSENSLSSAVAWVHYDAVEILINGGADVNMRLVNGDTVLLHAIGKKATSIVDILINSGADINAINDDGVSIISSAIQSRDSYIIRSTLNHPQFVKYNQREYNRLLKNEEDVHREIEKLLSIGIRKQ